jgi:nucleotide-binding universal stress UspA family protein
MKSFHRAMVALDLSTMDRQLLEFLTALGPALGIRKVYLLHAIPDFTMPDNVDVEFHKLFNPEYPIDEKIRDKIALDVQELFGNLPGIEFAIEVVEGKPYEKLLHWVDVKEVDLLVVGHKEVSEGSGITPRRVARKAECHVLFVTPESPRDLQRIAVPIDFSENSQRALETALAIKRDWPEVAVQCIYVVDMPPADYYIRPFDNTGYRRLLLDSARNAYRSFLEDNGIDSQQLMEPEFIPNEYSNVAAHLGEYVRQNPVDLVIIGAQGHSAFEHFIFGSVTERFVERCKSRPVLVIR